MNATAEIFYSLDGARRIQRESHPGWNTYLVEDRRTAPDAWRVVSQTHSLKRALDVCVGDRP